MIGYIKVYSPELKMKEYTRYSAYYCGLCHSIKNKWGNIPRLSLNYDSLFIALLLDSIKKPKLQYKKFRCIVHPMYKKNRVINSESLEYVAGINLFMYYLKASDDVMDQKNVYRLLVKKYLQKHIDKIEIEHPKLVGEILDIMQKFHKLELEKCSNIDEISHLYASIMRMLISYSLEDLEEYDKQILSDISYNIGKWVYLADAFEDIEQDIKKGSYNAFLYRFAYEKGEDIAAFKQKIEDRSAFILYAPLNEAVNCYKELDLQYKDPIVENILYEGLYDRTSKILNGGNIPNDK